MMKATLLTSRAPGAIAIIHLSGEIGPALHALTGRSDWPTWRVRLSNLADIDEGLVVRLSDQTVQVMPHGGPRVVEQVLSRLVEVGAQLASPDHLDPRGIYPEAKDEYEAIMLATMARTASPLALELLPAALAAWRAFSERPITSDERERSMRLNRLIEPPLVVLAGPPNVGKSTLSNALLGRSMSLALDLPGTTRDYTAALIELRGVVVQWHDTPGIRASEDAIENRAIEIARALIARAALLISMTDAEHDWIDASDLPRTPDLHIVNKCDTGSRSDGSLHISAKTGEGLAELVSRIRDALVPPADLESLKTSRWLFDERLASL